MSREKHLATVGIYLNNTVGLIRKKNNTKKHILSIQIFRQIFGLILRFGKGFTH